MIQLAIQFPPPMTAKQLAAANDLARRVEENKRSFAVQDFDRRRKAALKYYRRVVV